MTDKAEPDQEPVHVIQPQPEIRNVESFSLYLSKDKRIDKGPKQEISSYSQVATNRYFVDKLLTHHEDRRPASASWAPPTTCRGGSTRTRGVSSW